jgi:hypothetical protein
LRCEPIKYYKLGATVSVEDVESLAQQYLDALNRVDIKAYLDLFYDDVEVFGLSNRMDNKK